MSKGRKQRDVTTWRLYAMMAWGALLSILGGMGSVAFLREIHEGEDIRPLQLIVRLVLPHMALLTGFGLILASSMLLRKNAIIEDQQIPDQTEASS